ncbi:MAG: aldo/keto reductase [Nitrosopumilus sp.]|nr:aldo/keto reductase [Nitrosopumilus sp.]
MLKRKFGWTDVKVPVIGQGTWMIDGDREWLSMEAIRSGLDLGMSHIDTAEMYGNGRVEELVSESIGGRRDEVFLSSKVLPTNASYDGTIKSCKQSLKRLQTDWLDLYMIHWPSSSYPIVETMRAMEKLVADGLIRFIGVSNFDLRELMNAEKVLRKERILCNQLLYNLDSRGIERRLLSYCTKQEIAIVGYSSFGHGNFPTPETSRGRILVEIGERHGKTPYQVALNFLTCDANVFTIPKTRSPERVKENSGGVGWDLTKDDIILINRFFPVPDYDTPLEVI